MLPVIGELRPWADPTVVAIRRLEMRSHHGAPRRSLDGAWSFRLFTSPDAVPSGAIGGSTPPAGRNGWVVQPVPGNWTVDPAVGDPPHYTNVQMPFPGPPPHLPERNPTGVYRRTFTVPASWRTRQVMLHVGGAESVHAAYLNGRFIGYGTDSRLASEYDISDALVDGDNHLAIVVVRYSAQSYVEDQDQWWMAGLHRRVFVESRPRTHLTHVSAAADYDVATGSGTVAVTTTIGFVAEPAAGWRVRTSLLTVDGETIGIAEGDVPHLFAAPSLFSGHRVVTHHASAGVLAWSAETPHRYRVLIELFDGRDRVVDRAEQWVGFRHVEVRHRQLLVNGRAIWIFGVNRHDHHPDRGKAVTPADMRADLVAMRAHNITAVRTSHYPNDSVFYDLCDELGMYVIDEANIESHAYNTSLCHDDRYLATWLARGSRMVARDASHPCIIAWSLGNESGYGANHDALAGWIRRRDSSRPLHYEGAVLHTNWVDGGVHATDIVCPMYPTIEAIRAHGASGHGKRPLIMCEYSHAMGNSNGSLADYWAAITSTPGLQGGFLWEWKDHGIRHTFPDGRVGLAYGGQFGDTPHDGNFVADGLMSADLQPHPAMTEVSWVYRPVTIARGRRRRSVRITNRQSFCDLSWLVASWELTVDGEIVESGELDGAALDAIAPMSSADVGVAHGPLPARGEAHLNVRFHTRQATWFAAAGHLVAWDQVRLRVARARPPARPRRSTGALSSVLDVSPELQLWRAPIDNDGFKLMPEMSERLRVGGRAMVLWQRTGIATRPAEELADHTIDRVVIDPDTVELRHSIVLHDGIELPARVGIAFELPARFGALRWFGRGPGENYPDRCAGSMVGVHAGRPDRQPYLVPQEFGLRTECRWFECIDTASGEVVRIEAIEPSTVLCSATHHTAADLFAARNAHELVPRRELIVHVDAVHRGVGTASCGPDVLPEYEIPGRQFRLTYRLHRRPGRLAAADRVTV